MSSPERVNVPLLSQLIPGGIRPATIFLVEFDPESQWFSIATTIVARLLQANGHAGYVAQSRPLEQVKHDLELLGVDVSVAQKEGRLTIDDQYSATLMGGRLESSGSQAGVFEEIPGGVRYHSLKVADLSVHWLKESKAPVAERSGDFAVVESISEMLRFNEEKTFAEWMVSRVNPEERRAKRVTLQAFVRGVHSEWFYKRMEAASDGVIDIRVMEREGEAKNFLRIRSLRGESHDARWHEISIKSGEANLT